MASLLERAIGAARLDPATYEDVEADPTALTQAMTVIAAVASGLGSGSGLRRARLRSRRRRHRRADRLVRVGPPDLADRKPSPEPETKSDLGELLRTIGFAGRAGVAGILGFIAVGGVILFAVALWQLAAMIVAVRQALDYKVHRPAWRSWCARSAS